MRGIMGGMARSLNRVDLLGWLGRDVKLQAFDGGGSVGEVSLATEYARKGADGKWETVTEWHTVRIQEPKAAAAVLVKGARVHLTGRLRTRSWEDREGQPRWRTEVVCHARDVIVVARPDRDAGLEDAGPAAGGDDGTPH